METNGTWTESQVESAACEALGANSPEESAAYQRQMAADTTGAARRLDRELRETAARLAAASPHMKPPTTLRGRILQATAPMTFKMEDYRKATREDYRFYKWGFYAAAMFLVMGALYNIDTRSKLGAALNTANKNVAALSNANRQANTALAAFIDPHGVQLTWQENGQVFGRGVMDVANHKALLVFPQELLAAGVRPRLSANIGGQEVPFETSLIVAPAQQIGFVLPARTPDLEQKPNVDKLTPDESNKIKVAGMQKLN
jgi:hypothetical protein